MSTLPLHRILGSDSFLEVVGSNLSTINWMDVFHIDLCKNCIVVYLKKRPGMAHL